jgi:hypothetical protein
MHDQWRMVRGLMSKPFQFSQLTGMAATMAHSAEQLAHHIHTLPVETVRRLDAGV